MVAQIVVARGPRPAEEWVLRHLDELFDEADASTLARPVRVIVPSSGMRQHLSAACARRRSRSVAGLRVQTLYEVAHEVLERAGERALGEGGAFDLIVERCARRQEALQQDLDGLDDAYSAVSSTVRELLDAGLEEVHAGALVELLRSDAAAFASRAQRDRAEALLATALAARSGAAEIGVPPPSGVFERAIRRLSIDLSTALPTRALVVHGFADPSGMAIDFLESLLRHLGGTVVLDLPPQVGAAARSGTGDGAGADAGSAYGERFISRLAQVAALAPGEPTTPAAPRVDVVAAPDPDAEAREVAAAIHDLVDAGAVAESIGVVARDLGAYALPLRRHLGALGVAFSGFDESGCPRAATGRMLAGLLELLQAGADLPTSRWLDLAHGLAPHRTDLRLALGAVGARRLADVRSLRGPDDEGLLLPIHDRLPRPGTETRRRVGPAVLGPAWASATALAEELDAWRTARGLDLAGHLARLERLVQRHLGWRFEDAPRRLLAERLAVMARTVPGGWTLRYDELVTLLRRSFADAGRVSLGGRGGGVAVLSAAAARGRVFSRLFVVGLSRDLFPRAAHEDPLLPDRLRHQIASLLPDLPIRGHALAGERYLFAQLVASAPRVTLSWSASDGRGRRRAPSPLLAQLGGASRGDVRCRKAPATSAGEREGPRPAGEWLTVAGVGAGQEAFGRLLPLALTPAGGDGEAAALARARLAVLAELEPPFGDERRRRPLLGPYFGFLGARDQLVAEAGWPSKSPALTVLEGLAACPWQTFLRRGLRLRSPPDPAAPLDQIDARLLGILVHRLLEEADSGSAESPPDGRRHAAEAAARRLLASRGVHLPGLAAVLAAMALPYVDVATRLDPAEDRRDRSEVSGSVTLGADAGVAAERQVSYRVDRLEERAAGALRLTDYKTGAPPEGGGRRPHARTARGEWLQVAAYVRQAPPGSVARYLFLRPDLADERREVLAEADDELLAGLFDDAVETLLQGWDAGAFFPRLIEPDEDVEPSRCRSCEVAEACLRRDSGARGRLRRWTEAAVEAPPEDAAQTALLGVWKLRGRRLEEEPG